MGPTPSPLLGQTVWEQRSGTGRMSCLMGIRSALLAGTVPPSQPGNHHVARFGRQKLCPMPVINEYFSNKTLAKLIIKCLCLLSKPEAARYRKGCASSPPAASGAKQESQGVTAHGTGWESTQIRNIDTYIFPNGLKDDYLHCKISYKIHFKESPYAFKL